MGALTSRVTAPKLKDTEMETLEQKTGDFHKGI